MPDSSNVSPEAEDALLASAFRKLLHGAVAPAGWHDDPSGVHQARYWDGSNWTHRVSDQGVLSDDPLILGAATDEPSDIDGEAGDDAAARLANAQTEYWYLGTDGQKHLSATPPVHGFVLKGNRWVAPPSGWRGVWDEMPTFGKVGIVVVTVLTGMFLIGTLGKNSDETGEDLEFGAFDVCQQFVKDRLRSPASAEFPNFFEDDGEVIVTSSGSVYTVDSQVDSQNGFGALLTTPFECKVRHTGGDRFRLLAVQLEE